MPNGSILQDHHVLEQRTLKLSQLLTALDKAGAFDIHAPENRIFLPADPQLAQSLGVTPHSGGPLPDYQTGTQARLLRIERSLDGQAAIAGDPDARNRVVERIANFRDTMKAGLVNGDLHTNAPLGLTANDIRPGVQSFFGSSQTYAQAHAQQISQFGTLSRSEQGWPAIIQSESRIISTLQYASQSSRNLIRGGDPEIGRQSLAQALHDSHSAGRLILSDTGIRQVHNVLGAEAAEPLRIPRGQRGFASMELLIGEVPRNTLIRSGGLLTTAVDLAVTGQRASELRALGNDAAAQSEVNHAVARNAGAWTGGAIAAATVGTSGFVPAAVVAGDALLMSKAFEKAVDLAENHAIYNQTDRDGVAWKFTGRNWTREGSIDATPDGVANPEVGRLGANYEKARELGALASAKAIDYALGKVPPPMDPFTVPARSDDRIGLDNVPWQRDPATEQWTRMVKTSVTGANDRGVYESQTASPERAQELNREAVGRIAENLKSGREAVASAYLENHAALRSGDFVRIPQSVQLARPEADRLMGSDEQVYRRNFEGQWTNADGQQAQGNLALELELTRVARQPSLERFDQHLAELQSRPAPTQEQVQQNELLHRYRVANIELKPEYQQAIEQAVGQTRQENGLSGAGALQLLRNESGEITADSAIAHYSRGSDGTQKLEATTTTEEIRAALAQIQGRGQSQEELPTLAAVAAVVPPDVRKTRDGEAQAQEPAAARPAMLADNPAHPDFDNFNRIHEWVRGTGQWDDEKSRNIAGALYKEHASDPLLKRVDKVCGALGRDGQENVFAVYAPHGDQGPFYRAQVDGREACQQPAQQNLEQAEQIKQQQVQQQTLEQQQQRDQAAQRGPAMSM